MRAHAFWLGLALSTAGLALLAALQSCGCAAIAVPPTIFYLRGGPPQALEATGLPSADAQALVAALALTQTGEIARHQTSCWSSSDNMRLTTRSLHGFGYPQPDFSDPYYLNPQGSAVSGQLVIAGDDSRFELALLPDTAGARQLELTGRFSLGRAQKGLFELGPEEATATQHPPAAGYTLLRVDWQLTGLRGVEPFTVTYSQAMQWRSTRQPAGLLLADLTVLPPFK